MSLNKWACAKIKTGIIGSDINSRIALRTTIRELGFQVCANISTDLLSMDDMNGFDEMPVLFIFDMTSHDENFYELIPAIRKKWSTPRLLVYGPYHEDDDVMDRTIIRMYKAGASGYVHKGEELKELKDAIEKLSASELHLSPRVISAFIDYYKNEADMRKLTFDTYY